MHKKEKLLLPESEILSFIWWARGLLSKGQVHAAGELGSDTQNALVRRARERLQYLRCERTKAWLRTVAMRLGCRQKTESKRYFQMTALMRDRIHQIKNSSGAKITEILWS